MAALVTFRVDTHRGRRYDVDLAAQAEVVADAMRDAAPVLSGAGRASIHAEKAGAEYHVGWDFEHRYLGFLECGTSHQPPRPFVRPAVDRLR